MPAKGIISTDALKEVPAAGTHVTHQRIRQRCLGLDPLVLGHLLALVVDRQQHVVLALALGPERLQANLERAALGDGIETLGELSARHVPNRLDGLVLIMVIHNLIRAEFLGEVKVPRTGRRHDLVPGLLGDLECKQADAGRSSVNQDPVLAIGLCGRVRQAETRVEHLGGRDESDAVRGCFVQRHGSLGRDLPREVTLDPQVFYSDPVSLSNVTSNRNERERTGKRSLVGKLAAVDHTGDMIPDLPLSVREPVSELDDDAGIITSDHDSGRTEERRVFPVGRVLGDVGDLDEDLVLVELRHRMISDLGSFFLLMPCGQGL